MMRYYQLDEQHNLVLSDSAEWRRNFGINRVALTDFDSGNRVSTVFLGLDHSFGEGEQPPLVFETMLFGGPCDGEMYRYSTWDEAASGHAKVVARCIEQGETLT